MTNSESGSAHLVALVTGASAGLGAEFATRLAERGMHLALVARRRDRLEELALKLRALHGIHVEVIPGDLSRPGAAGEIVAHMAGIGMSVDLLVNNAGFGTHGHFEAIDPQREQDEIAVNVASLVALTHACLPAMLARGRGGIINLASTAAFQPVPYMTTYAATKAFVRSFSEGLHEEVRTRGVKVLALCPGATATEFFNDKAVPGPGPMRTSRDVVTTALRAYDAGIPAVVDGIGNVAMTTLQGLLPRSLVTRLAGNMMRPRP